MTPELSDAPALAQESPGPQAPPRLGALDAARGLAVIAMVAYHFVWDLGHFGLIDPNFPYAPGFKAFGRAIALCFLFIAGLSLALAHGRGLRPRAFWRRFFVVAGAAALVSAGTFAAFPKTFVFFGILHCIAAASLLALPLLPLPWPAALAAALAAIAAPLLFTSAAFDAPWFWWTGLSAITPLTNDYQPLLPWSAALFAGVAAAKLLLAAPRPAPAGAALGALGVLGRHSLLIYLVHQPLLFAGFAALALLAPPDDVFLAECADYCQKSGGAKAYCQEVCACTQREWRKSGAAEIETAARACADKSLRPVTPSPPP